MTESRKGEWMGVIGKEKGNTVESENRYNFLKND